MCHDGWLMWWTKGTLFLEEHEIHQMLGCSVLFATLPTSAASMDYYYEETGAEQDEEEVEAEYEEIKTFGRHKNRRNNKKRLARERKFWDDVLRPRKEIIEKQDRLRTLWAQQDRRQKELAQKEIGQKEIAQKEK